MNKFTQRLTLDQPAAYQIKVSGQLDEAWIGWNRDVAVSIEDDGSNMPVSTLTCVMDQSALHGLLRRLFSFGLPIISVLWIDPQVAERGH